MLGVCVGDHPEGRVGAGIPAWAILPGEADFRGSATFTPRLRQPRDAFLAPTSPQAHGVLPLAPGGRSLRPASGTPAGFMLVGAAGRDEAILYTLQLPSTGPVSIALLYTADPKSLRTYSPIPPNLSSEPSPIYPAGYLLWDVPTGLLHQVQNQIYHLSPN